MLAPSIQTAEFMDSITVVNSMLLLGSALVIVGVLSSLIASRVGAPLLLFFLLIGVLAGEDGPGGIIFENYRATYLVGSLALAVILFDGGMRTRIANLSGTIAPAAVLATVGVVLTAALTGAVAAPLLGISYTEGLLVGAMVASTDAAAVFFLLRAGGLQLHRRVGTTLEVESSTNDPVAVLLTVILVSLLAGTAGSEPLQIVRFLLQEAVLGAVIGLLGGFLLTVLVNRIELSAGLQPLFVVASAVALFATTELLDGSGFLAAYLAGLVLGNRRVRAFGSISAFHETVTWLVQIVMFIMLGLLVSPSEILGYLWQGLLIATFLILVARPIAVVFCLVPFGFPRRERLFISWVGLRGAVSIFLAAIPTIAGLPDGALYFNIAFIVVVVSLLVQGWTLTPLARRLNLALPRTRATLHRVEIDLPGQAEHEMVGYYIEKNSAVLSRGASPRWARPVFVVREDRVMEPGMAGELQPGDYAYFLAPLDRVRELDRLFAAGAGPRSETVTSFPLRGGAELATLNKLYGLELSEELLGRTVAEHFSVEFENEPAPGDRLAVGPAMLTVRTMKDGQVAEAELELDLDSEGKPAPRGTVADRALIWIEDRARRFARRLNAG